MNMTVKPTAATDDDADLVIPSSTVPQDLAEVPERHPSMPLAKVTPMQMCAMAAQRGATMEELERFMSMAERDEDRKAEKAFHAAMAQYKANEPTVRSDMTNSQYDSGYVSKGNLVSTVNTVLCQYGLSARWTFPPTEDMTVVTVTCILSHKGGHSEEVTFSGPLDNSGQKNPLQQRKSTVTYLQIITFEAVTGTASNDSGNDDGNSSGSGVEYITDEQAQVIEDLLGEVAPAPADYARFLKAAKAGSVDEIRASQYETAIVRLEAKRGGV